MRQMFLFLLLAAFGCGSKEANTVDSGPQPVDADGDGYTTAEDCNDDDSSVYPGAQEVCDGVDNDCDGEVDGENAVDAQTFYADTDLDGYGDPATVVVACERLSGLTEDDTDCNDTNSSVYPGAQLTCGDGVVNDCNATEAEELAQCAASGSQSPSSLSTDHVLTFIDSNRDAGYAHGAVSALDVDGDGGDDLCVHGYRTNSFTGLYCYTDPLQDYVDEYGMCEDAASESDVQVTNGDASRHFAEGNSVSVVVGGVTYVIVADEDYIVDGSYTGAAYIYNTDVSQPPVAILEGSSDGRIDGDSLSVQTPMANGDQLLAIGLPEAGNESLERTGCVCFVDPSSFTGNQPVADVATQQVCGDNNSNIDELGAAIATGDLDGNGSPETVICAPGALGDNGQCFVFSAQSLGVYTNLYSFLELRGDSGERFGSTVALADVTGDGALDIIVGAPKHDRSAGNEGVVYVFASGGETPWTQRYQIDSADADGTLEGTDRGQYFGGRIATGDFNGDGFTDLFVGSYDGPNLDTTAPQVEVFLNTRDGGLSTAPWLTVTESADGVSIDMVGANSIVGDFNDDGYPDLATGHRSKEAIYVWLGGGI